MKNRSNIHVWIKGQGKEKIVLEVLKAYEACYPHKFEFYRQNLRRLREVTIGSHKDLKGREVDINFRVPTEPFLFLQSIWPDFGKDSDDIQMLIRLWEDFAVAKTRRHKKVSLLWSNRFLASESPLKVETTESSGSQPATILEPPGANAADVGIQPQPADRPSEQDDPGLRRDDREELLGVLEGHPLLSQPQLPA